jgi:hypothetical protein
LKVDGNGFSYDAFASVMTKVGCWMTKIHLTSVTLEVETGFQHARGFQNVTDFA